MHRHPNADLDATISPSAHAVLSRAPLAPSEQAGQMIGRYKLLQPIGEGGFGSVWMAEQREPVKRRVALKIIKLGMDTKQVIARFEAERQALAMMDHPNIAKVLDAGATETGRPYFVMEYIKGVPILEYCDTDKLDTKARLALFGNVCHAIQHAHQKGIIHRDIKPSNVLITMHDGVPVPKVIDFGIAKATCAELTTKTLFTEHRQMIGTPAYMSPEQAEMSGLDIDTRSDIYSLGVLLYELLTGTTPFAHEELMSKGFAEMMRIIREVEPHKPSTRLSSLGDTGTRTALQRHAGDVKKLGLILRGDLDWIVMKCLEKDRTRRYETANGLAADIKRHLSDQPITAGAPSAGYRLRKFVKRNRGQVIAASIVTGALVLGVVGTTRGMVWALNEKSRADVEKNNATLAAASEAKAKVEAQDNEKRAVAEAKKAEAVTKFLERMFAAADPHTKQRPGLTMRELLDEVAPTVATNLADQPEVQARIHSTIGLAYQHLGEFGEAESHLKRALEFWRTAPGDRGPAGLADATFKFGWLYHDMGDFSQAEQVVRGAQALTVKNHGADSLEAYGVLAYVADLQRHLGDYIKAEKLLREVIAKTENGGPEGAVHTRYALRILSLVLTESGRPGEGEEAQRRLDAMVGDGESPNTTERLTSLAVLRESLEKQGKFAEARDLSERAIMLVRQQAAVDGNDPFWLIRLLQSLADRAELALKLNDADTAERIYTEQVEVSRKLITLQPETPTWPTQLAAVFQIWGDLSMPPWNRADAARHYQDAVDAARAGLKTFPNNTNLFKYVQNNLRRLAESALKTTAPEQAERLYQERVEVLGALCTLEPTELAWPTQLAALFQGWGDLSGSPWNRADAARHYQDAVDAARAGLKTFPNNTNLFELIQHNLWLLAESALKSKAPEQAERLYQERVEALGALCKLEPTEPNWPRQLAWLFQGWGDLSGSPWNRADAARHYQDAVDAARTGLKTFPNDTNLRKNLQHNLWQMAESALKTKAPERAERAYLEQIEAFGILRTLEPTEPNWPKSQSFAAERMGRIALARWDRSTASGHFNKAVEYAKAGVAALPNDDALKTRLKDATTWVDWLAKLPAPTAAPGTESGRNPYRIVLECTRVIDERTVETVEGFQLRPQGTWWLHKIDDKEKDAYVRAAFEALVLGGADKRVEIEFDGYLAYKDRAGIVYANLYVNGVCLNEKMLREGYYDLYDRIDYQSKEKYRALRDEARAAGRGLWATASAPIEAPPKKKR